MLLKTLFRFKLLYFSFLCSTLALLFLPLGSVYSKTEISVFKVIDSARATINRSKMEETQRRAAIDHPAAALAGEREAETLHERVIARRAETVGEPQQIESLENESGKIDKPETIV